MKITQVKVDPDKAEEWLSHNTHNRHVRGAIVSSYANAMRAGEWTNDIDPIAFHGSLTGKGKNRPVLLNGQHRLMAVIASDSIIEFMVVEGLPMNSQLDMDAGVKRQFGDQLRLDGVPNPFDVAAITRLVHGYDSGTLRQRGTTSYSTLMRFLQEHADIADSVNPARAVYYQIGGRVSVLGAAYYILASAPGAIEDAAAFFDALKDGVGLEKGSPILLLRNGIMQMTAATPGRRVIFDQMTMLAVIIKAWNAWRTGNPLAGLSWRGGGKNPEPFPTPV